MKKRQIKAISIQILLILVVIFAIQNSEMTEIDFLFWTFEVSRTLIIIGSACIGIVAGIILAYLRRKKTVNY